MIPTRTKYPTEAKVYSFDFTQKLEVGDSIPAQVPVMDIDAGLTASNAVLDSASNTVSVRLSGGISGQSYNVAATVTSSLGDKLKLAVTIEITNAAN
jgi:hypothetical protein